MREGVVLLTDKRKQPFIVDADDVEAVSRYPWALSNGYPRTRIGKGATGRSLKLHQFLLGKAPAGLEWDHINRDKSDNRRCNLRLVTPRENKQNRVFRIRRTLEKP